MKKILLIAIMAIFTTGVFAAKNGKIKKVINVEHVTKVEPQKITLDEGGFPVKLSCGFTYDMPKDMVTGGMVEANIFAMEWLICQGGLAWILLAM